VAVRLGRDLLRLREQRLDLAQVEQRVAALLLLDDARDDVSLTPGELLVRHLALGVAQLLEDDLLRGLRADAPLELVGNLDLFLGHDLHLERGGLASASSPSCSTSTSSSCWSQTRRSPVSGSMCARTPMKSSSPSGCSCFH